MVPIVPQLDKSLKFMAFQGVILYRVQSFLSPQMDLKFRHLSSCDTIDLEYFQTQHLSVKMHQDIEKFYSFRVVVRNSFQFLKLFT